MDILIEHTLNETHHLQNQVSDQWKNLTNKTKNNTKIKAAFIIYLISG